MKKISIIILSIMFLLGLWAAFLPNVKPHLEKVKNKDLAILINYHQRYLTVDDVAKALMQKDRFLLLVDVRNPEQYKSYTLPGAINMPVDSILNPSNLQILSGSNVYNIVFFSNGTSLADKAWLIATATGIKNLHVLKGGLNAWFNQLLQPKRPPDWAKQAEFKKYEFRKAAARFFTGATTAEQSSSKAPVKVQVPVKKKQVGGGCE